MCKSVKYVIYKNIYKTGILANCVIELDKYNNRLNDIPSDQNTMDYTLNSTEDFITNSIYGLLWPVTFSRYILNLCVDIDLVTQAN